MMKLFVCLVGLLCLLPSMAKDFPPKVQVYSRTPGKLGRANTLICHASGFHPPEITIELLKNGQKMTKAKQTDLTFEENWHYHLTKFVDFTPNPNERYACNVTHMGRSKIYQWEPDM